MAKLENQPQIQSLGSKLNMFDLESLLYFDSTWKHTLCTIKFILKEFYLFKQIHIYKITKNFKHLLLLTFHVTCETPYIQHMKHYNATHETSNMQYGHAPIET